MRLYVKTEFARMHRVCACVQVCACMYACMCVPVTSLSHLQSVCSYYPGSYAALRGVVQVCAAVSQPCLGAGTGCPEGTT